MIGPITQGVIVGGSMVLSNSILEETQLVKHTVDGVKYTYNMVVDTVEYTETLGFGGMTGDNVSKFLVVAGMGGLVTSLFVTAPIVVKSVVAGSIGCFMVGFARGVMKSVREIRKENDHVA